MMQGEDDMENSNREVSFMPHGCKSIKASRKKSCCIFKHILFCNGLLSLMNVKRTMQLFCFAYNIQCKPIDFWDLLVIGWRFHPSIGMMLNNTLSTLKSNVDNMCNCHKYEKFIHKRWGHVITNELKIVTHTPTWDCIAKGLNHIPSKPWNIEECSNEIYYLFYGLIEDGFLVPNSKEVIYTFKNFINKELAILFKKALINQNPMHMYL